MRLGLCCTTATIAYLCAYIDILILPSLIQLCNPNDIGPEHQTHLFNQPRHPGAIFDLKATRRRRDGKGCGLKLAAHAVTGIGHSTADTVFIIQFFIRQRRNVMIMACACFKFLAQLGAMGIVRTHAQKGHPLFFEAFDRTGDISLVGGLVDFFYALKPLLNFS